MKKKTMIIGIGVVVILGLIGAISSCRAKDDNTANDCKFDFLKTDIVEISRYNEKSYFKINKDEDKFDISNLEFISEDPEIASFSYDSTALGNYIYYNIEPLSKGETNVYVKCKECGEESQKLHVIVDLPETTEPITEDQTNINDTEKNTTNITTTENLIEEISQNPLMLADFKIGNVMSSDKSKKLGEYGYIKIQKDELKSISMEDYNEFCNKKVKDSGYNWISIICEDGTGICFSASIVDGASYGELDNEGCIRKTQGIIMSNFDGTYEYTEYNENIEN